MARHPRLQSNLAYGRATARAAAHTRGEPVPPHTRAELRREMSRLRLLAEQIREIEDGAPRTAGTTAKPWCPSDDPITSAGPWPRYRDRRHARPRGLLAPLARPPGGGALRRADRRSGRERG